MSKYISKSELEEKNNQYISEEDAMIILYVFTLLDEYDRADNNSKPQNDPYKQNIYVKSEEGLNLIIPEDTQRYAIHKWLESKQSKESEKSSCDNSFTNSVVQLIICLLIVFFFMYSLSCFRKGITKFGNKYGW
jgi:hypothetical protein